MTHEVKIPRINTNDDTLLVHSISVIVGRKVSTGDELFVVESSKAAVSVTTDAAGYIRKILITEGERVEVGTIACILTDTANEAIPEQLLAGLKKTKNITNKASERKTAKQRLLEKRRLTGSGKKSGTFLHEHTSIEIVPGDDLEWVQETRSYIESNASCQKKLCSIKGGVNGKKVKINDNTIAVGKNTVLKATKVYYAGDITIGDNTYIEADTLYIGTNATIGTNTKIVTGDCIISDGAYIGDSVEIDISGGKSINSKLFIGPAALISPGCYVNTCKEVILEQESALSPGAMIFTHRFWQSVLEGYMVSFAPVRLCKNSWVGGGCHIMPGTIVGEGATVMSNSTVVNNIAPYTLAGGVPATTLRSNVRQKLSQKEKVTILTDILSEFESHLQFKQCKTKKKAGTYNVTLPDGTLFTIRLRTEKTLLESSNKSNDNIIIEVNKEEPQNDELSVFNITAQQFSGSENKLCHELRNYLRRRGIRFRPFGWNASYRYGL